MSLSLSKTFLSLSLACLLSSCANPPEPQPTPTKPNSSATKTAEVEENEAIPKYRWDEIHGWNRAKVYLQNNASEAKPLPMKNVNGTYYSTPGESYSVCVQNNTPEGLGIALSRQGLDTDGKAAKPMELIHIIGPNTIRCFANTKLIADAIPVVSWKLYNIGPEQKEDQKLAPGAVFAGQGAIYLSETPLDKQVSPWSSK